MIFDDESQRTLEKLLRPGCSLNGLISGYRAVLEDKFAFDIQLLGFDGLHFIHGSAVLLRVGLDRCNQTVCLIGGTYCGNHYRRQYGECYAGDLEWIVDAFPVDDAARGCELIPHYLRSAAATCDASRYRDGRRGYWLNWLSLSFGQDWHSGREWLLVERDRTVSRPQNSGGLAPAVYATFRRFEILKHRLQQADSTRWGPPTIDGIERECDFIGISPSGELLCVDVRHGSDGLGIVWSAVKLVAYAKAIRLTEYSELIGDLKSRLSRRVALGLVRPEALNRLRIQNFIKVVPVVVVAEPDDKSECWNLLEELADRDANIRVRVVKLSHGQSADEVLQAR